MMAGGRIWTDSEDILLLEHAASGMFFAAIAGRHQRSKESVRLRYLELLRGMSREDRKAAKLARDENVKTPRFIGFLASDSEIADRDDRLRLKHSSLTAIVFGDPLPGRSALDLRNSNLLQQTGDNHASHH
jgi:hypothetical protein